MLDESTRSAILRLRSEGHGARTIARVLKISRGAVRDVIADGTAAVPPIARAEKGEAHRAQILELYAQCKGNLVRVHEELVATGAKLSYQALTAFCRRHGLGQPLAPPAGQYTFVPGEEMQHDTSPHYAEIGGRRVAVQTASLVLCHSRMMYVQMYPRFTRLECKVFLTDAVVYMGGACGRCMIDNTHVVVLAGTGRDMVPAPEMAAFAERFHFEFRAHAVGDANRSARVERPFDFIDNNFLAGRRFADWAELDRELLAWCDKVNQAHRRHLHGSARELYAAERPAMRPLPIFVPEVYALHSRIVDTEGYVNVQRGKYSVPWQMIGRRVEVRETKDRIDVYEGPRRVTSHIKLRDGLDTRVTLSEHRPPRSEGLFARRAISDCEKRLGERMPEMIAYVALLKKRRRAATRDLRFLTRMLDEYPRPPLAAALAEAVRYGMTDLDRLERMVLRLIARDFFRPPGDSDPDPEGNPK